MNAGLTPQSILHLPQLVHELYSRLAVKIPLGQYTILAAFILTYFDAIKVISFATGSKCLPTDRFSKMGDALHDSHAEVLARRGAVRWLMEEVRQASVGQQDSAWLLKASDGKYSLKEGVHTHLYVSTVPCKSYELEMSLVYDTTRRR